MLVVMMRMIAGPRSHEPGSGLNTDGSDDEDGVVGDVGSNDDEVYTNDSDAGGDDEDVCGFDSDVGSVDDFY